ncbi:MAG: hypothetical protein ABEJ65_02850 [bacterium]
MFGSSLSSFTGITDQRVGFGTDIRFSDRLPEWFLARYKSKKTFNTYGIGGYLIWKWWPEKKVFIDSRSRAYDSDFLNNYVRSNVQQLLKTHEFEYAIVPTNRPIPFLFFIPSPSWTVEAYDEGLFAFRKVEQSRDIKPENKLLYSRRERKKLPKNKRAHLKGVNNFISVFQNREQYIDKFHSPEHARMAFHQYKNQEPSSTGD